MKESRTDDDADPVTVREAPYRCEALSGSRAAPISVHSSKVTGGSHQIS
jgi:hypothetical protein